MLFQFTDFGRESDSLWIRFEFVCIQFSWMVTRPMEMLIPEYHIIIRFAIATTTERDMSHFGLAIE